MYTWTDVMYVHIYICIPINFMTSLDNNFISGLLATYYALVCNILN